MCTNVAIKEIVVDFFFFAIDLVTDLATEILVTKLVSNPISDRKKWSRIFSPATDLATEIMVAKLVTKCYATKAISDQLATTISVAI